MRLLLTPGADFHLHSAVTRGAGEMFPSIIALLTLISVACGQSPGLQVILTNKGLQYGKHVGAGWIQDRLNNITFPDISGKVLGTIHFTLTGITITKCDFPEPSVEFYQDATGFKTSMSGLSVALAGWWRTRFGIIHDGGSFNLAIFSVDVTSVVGLGKDADGRLSVTSVSCDANVGDVDMQFYGGASPIFKPFVKYFKGRIKGEIQRHICPKLEEAIVMIEEQLQAMNVSFDVDQDVTLEFPLTDLPVVNASSMNLGLKGEFYSIKHHEEPPFKPQLFAVPEQQGYMLSVGLSEFTLNSASYGYYLAGLFQALINDSVIPPSLHMHLNTSEMGPFIPQLPKMFPDLLMNLQVYARDAPLFSFQPGAIKLDFHGAVKAFAIQPNHTQTPLFNLNVDSDFSGKVWVADGKLKASMGMNNLTVTLASSEVGPFKTDAIEKAAKLGSTIFMANVNEILGKGADLPRMKQVVPVNTVLKMDMGFIAIFSDAQVLTDGDFD